jgi:para-nitrobenzyl esterase
VCTSLGPVRGAVEGDVIAFKGIAYAQPPIGTLRWRAPEPPSRWAEVRDATAYGPMCPQLLGDEVVGDEDCLTVNVWTARNRQAPLRPVMIYFTGGGNHAQSGQGQGPNGSNFVGTRLVPEGVVLVTFNYRLGALGFLSHPALDTESDRRVSGNYGNQDHIALLRWVQQNIEAFGGNPKQVLLFGTSAGGANICGLLTSPLATGLFHAAAMQSSVPTGCEFHTMAQAQARTGLRLAQVTGCNEAGNAAACLRAKSPSELVRALPAVTNLFPRTYGPVVDGYVFPEQPLKLLAEGKALKIPVIIGNTLEETAGWVDGVAKVADDESYRTAIERIFGADLRDHVVAQYPTAGFDSPRTAFLRATTDALFTCATVRVEQAILHGGGGPVFRYLFSFRRLEGTAVGHSIEIGYLFYSWNNRVPGVGDRDMSDQMIKFWTHIAKVGDPNDGTTAHWQAARHAPSPFIELNVPSVTREGHAGALCDFWNSLTLPSPHL